MRRKLKPQQPQLHSLQPRLRQRPQLHSLQPRPRQRRRLHSLQPPCCQRPRPPRQVPRCGMTPQDQIGIAQTSTPGKRPMPSSWPRVVRTATLIAWTATAMACPASHCRVPHRSGIRLVVTLANVGIESTRYGEYNAGRVLTHEQLLRQVWGHDKSGGSGPVRTIVKRLRRKLGRPCDNPTLYLHQAARRVLDGAGLDPAPN